MKETIKNASYNLLRVELGALATGMFYTSQLERINAFNRIRNIMYRKIKGIGLTEKQDKQEEKEFKQEFTDSKLAKKIKELLPKLKGEEKRYIEKIMILLEDMRKQEKSYQKLMKDYIEPEPIYDTWLKDIKGISTLNTANLLQYFGYCEKAKHASSLWKFAGLTPDSKKEKGKQLDFSPKLRMLMYRIGDCFVKARTPKYRDIYDKAKEEYTKRHLNGECEACNKIKKADKPGHPDAMARRKMIKAFLIDYYEHCLALRGLPPDKPYSARFHPEDK
jgi:hypothetical protein